jgi:hypothetical protein
MKNLLQLQLELSKNEQLTQVDLTNIMGGRKRNKAKFFRRVNENLAMAISYSYERVAPEATDDDKRRPRPGGGTTTTSPSFL